MIDAGRAHLIDQLVASVDGLSSHDRPLLTQAIELLARCARSDRRVQTTCCIGLSTDTGRAWWPEGDYWPHGVPREWTPQGLMRALEAEGWERCDSREREPYRRKLAILGRPMDAGMYSPVIPIHVVSMLDDPPTAPPGTEPLWGSKTPYLEPFAIRWAEIEAGVFDTLTTPVLRVKPLAIMRKWAKPGRRCE